MNSLEDLRLNGPAHRREALDEDIAGGGIVAEDCHLPCRHVSWMMPALKSRPLEIFVPFHVLIGRAKECFDTQTLIADAYKFDDLNGVR
jgi:hypothetical protein